MSDARSSVLITVDELVTQIFHKARLVILDVSDDLETAPLDPLAASNPGSGARLGPAPVLRSHQGAGAVCRTAPFRIGTDPDTGDKALLIGTPLIRARGPKRNMTGPCGAPSRALFSGGMLLWARGENERGADNLA